MTMKPLISPAFAIAMLFALNDVAPLRAMPQEPMPAPTHPIVQGVPATYRTETQVVPVNASVTDRSGQFVAHLTRDDFEVRDNGKLQPITVFTSGQAALNAVVLLDGSRSLVRNVESVIAAADHFVVRLMPGDQARVGSFSDQIRLHGTFTADRDELSRQVNDLFNLRLGMKTRLWDAVRSATESFVDSPRGQRVVIAFTDGDDTASDTSFDTVIREAQRLGVRVYLVLVAGGERMPEERNGSDTPADFRRLAQTGGGYFIVRAKEDFNAAATQLTQQLHSEYLLGFAPSALDGKVHKLDVKVRRPGIFVRARQQYLATALAILGIR